MIRTPQLAAKFAAQFAALFLAISLPRLARGDAPAAAADSSPRTVRRAVERAIPYLQTESATWLAQRKCAACHHVPMPLWALGEAARQGYAIDRKFVAETIEAAIGAPEKMIASRLVSGPADPPDPRPMAKGVNIGTVFMAVAARSMPSLTEGQEQSVRRILDDVVKKQRDDGSWDFFLSRPPVNESQATDAAWIIMSLQDPARPGDKPTPDADARRAAADKATAWLAGAEPDNRQADVLRLLVAIRAKTPRDALQPAIDRLLARQRPDGGWSQTADAASDAFATGQALYVLSVAGYTTNRPDLRRAVDYLLATQNPDGSWPMTSRSSPDGKPGGAAKLLTPITCAATSWATLALARLEPQRP